MAGLRNGRNLGQFARSFDLWMTRENLFDHRRTRAHHSHYKNRFVALRTRTRKFPEQVGRKDLSCARHIGGQHIRIVLDCKPPEGIASRVIAEGFFVVAAIGISLSKRKMQAGAIIRRDIRFCDCSLHLRDLFVGEPEGFQIREIPPCAAAIRIQCEDLPTGRDTFLEPSQPSQHIGVADPVERPAGILFRERTPDRRRTGKVIEIFQSARLDRAIFRIVGLRLQCLLDQSERLVSGRCTSSSTAA